VTVLGSKASLTHADKVSEAEQDEAKIRFQEIAFAYAVLSDSKRRARYDATGRTSETLGLDDDEDGEFNWGDFYRSQFEEVITEGAIEKFKKEYQGSEEEKMHVIEAYVTFEGDMDGLFSEVMLSDPLEDEERFRAIIDEEIEEKRVEAYKAYTKESKATKKKRVQTAKKEAKEAEEMAKEMGIADKLFGNGKSRTKKDKDDTSGLAALIQQRQQSRQTDFFADLEAKYAPKGKNKRTADDEPPEEAFQRTASRRKSKEKPEVEASPRKTKRSKRERAA
jgi:DnaJ family protein C protein 9